MEELIQERLVCLDAAADSDREAIGILGELLADAGYCRAAYTAAALTREESFPTGIALPGGGIAIPHASPEDNVLKNGIAVLRLRHPVAFRSMENAEEEVSVRFVFMLALKEAHAHLALLQKLFGLFQQASVMATLEETADKRVFQRMVLENLA